MIKLSRLLLTHEFHGENTSGMQARNEIIHRLEERDRVGFLLPLLVKKALCLSLFNGIQLPMVSASRELSAKFSQVVIPGHRKCSPVDQRKEAIWS
jgi:hypothetical protein